MPAGDRRPKITVVGAGNVGASVAQYAVERELGDVVLVDVIEGIPQGKALDLAQAGPVHGYDAVLTGSNGYDETSNSDIVVITAGLARKPGMTRDDLLFKNAEIVGGVVEQVVARSPGAILGVEEVRVPAPAGGRHGGHPRFGPVPHLHRPGAPGLRGERDGLRAGRSR